MESISLEELQGLTENEVRSNYYWSTEFLGGGSLGMPNCTKFCIGAWSWCVDNPEYFMDNANGNADQWFSRLPSRYGYISGDYPLISAIACFSGGSSNCGHVAFVYGFSQDSDGWYVINTFSSYYNSTYFVDKTYRVNQNAVAQNEDGSNTNLYFQGFVYHPQYKYVDTEGNVQRTIKTRTYKLKKVKTSIDNLTADTARTDEHWGSNFVDGGYSKSLTNPCAFALGAWSWCYGAIAEDQTFEKFLKRGYLGYPDDPRFLYSEYAFDKSSTISLGALVCLDKTKYLDGTTSYPSGRVGMVTGYNSETGNVVISFFDYNETTGRVEVNNVGFNTPPNTGVEWKEAGGGYCPGYMTHKYFEKYYWEEVTV